VPSFDPFAGVRYRREDVSAVIAPPYDVISEQQRLDLEAADPHNAVRLELPQPEGDLDRYEAAARRLHAWLEKTGPLVVDREPALYIYRMSFTDEGGHRRATTGVIGSLGLEPSDGGEVLPHERTTPKAKTDRLELLRATGTNLSPVWALSLAHGLSERLRHESRPVFSGTDAAGVVHEVWPLADPEAVASVGAAIGGAPVVIADGHHRYEVALTYQSEQRRVRAGAAGPWDAVMTFVVELSERELSVAAIHRLISDLPADFNLLDALAEWFEPLGSAPLNPNITARMSADGALAVLIAPANEARLMRARPKTVEAAEHDLDSSRLDLALAALPAHRLTYQHGVAEVAEAVRAGAARAAVLLRPATVAQIAEVARSRHRMPPKTTFFTPKPATGLVFRSTR
jgi:uncharacterized protein (DUF1015 family)